MKGSKSQGAQADPDVGLMLRFQQGDEAAFRELFERHNRAIVNYVNRLVHDRARSEELAQDVFLKVYRAAGSYKPKASFKVWLYRIATNHCLNQLRRREHRVRVVSLDAEGAAEQAGREPDPGELAVAGEVAEALQEALMTLPQRQRLALIMNRMEGLAYDEVATVLGVSTAAVKSLINRAATALRECLRPYLEGEAREEEAGE